VERRYLWVSDGTADGTVALAPATDRTSLASMGGKLFFVGDDGDSGWELWATDGTREGTRLVKDIDPGTSGSQPQHMTVFGDRLYFRAEDDQPGHGLWRTNGTEAGTEVLLRPISIDDIAASEDHLYLRGTYGGQSGLWRSDGTAAGTLLLKKFNTHGYSDPPADVTVINDRLYFAASDGADGFEPWTSDERLKQP
jgi:ELWxxDGT repeat protein